MATEWNLKRYYYIKRRDINMTHLNFKAQAVSILWHEVIQIQKSVYHVEKVHVAVPNFLTRAEQHSKASGTNKVNVKICNSI